MATTSSLLLLLCGSMAVPSSLAATMILPFTFDPAQMTNVSICALADATEAAVLNVSLASGVDASTLSIPSIHVTERLVFTFTVNDTSAAATALTIQTTGAAACNATLSCVVTLVS